jgi:hypothetical protein
MAGLTAAAEADAATVPAGSGAADDDDLPF